MGEATGTSIQLFCFDKLCQLAYVIYITKANAGINILSVTVSYRDYMSMSMSIVDLYCA